ncbi:hypothetical protein Y032_0005g2673 [Ancylostoma ceylanicum]|uniref:Uncharacterized protein n=1 Tax=Ancylostoma ceylanicum TaxID=53326 RepID=A0A016VT52_9BILA|nr:hypothetical protein Y032_0005g2673 [Ancylostoma ceylanicum]
MFLRLFMPLQTADLAFWISKCDRNHFLDEVLHEAGLRTRRSSRAEAVQRRAKLTTDSQAPESDIQPCPDAKQTLDLRSNGWDTEDIILESFDLAFFVRRRQTTK